MTDLEHALTELSIHRRFAIDILSVAEGVRRLGLIHAPLPAEPSLRRVLDRMGLRVFTGRRLVRSDDPNSREGVLRDCNDSEDGNYTELWYARHETAPLPESEALFANPGRHLGYPRCCVAEWERRQSQRDFYQRYLLETRAGHWEINRLATLFQEGLLIPDFYPCSLSCDAAREFALPILALAEEALDPVWVRATARWMQAPLLLHAGSLYAFPQWTLTESRLELVLSEARRVPLAAVGSFDPQLSRATRLLAFRQVADMEEAVLLTADGAKTAVAFA